MIQLVTPEYLVTLQNNMRKLAEGVLRPISRKYDEAEHEYPKELDMFRNIKVMARPKKKKDGEKSSSGEEKKPKRGANLGMVATIEEMCWGDAALLLSFPNAGLGNAAIIAVANDEQFERFGNKWAAMAITEPGAGSDSGAITTTATRDGDFWVLNGEKIFVTCADRSEVVVVWATVDKKAGKSGIKSFVVEKGTPGFTLEHLEHKLGIRASDTGTFVLSDCRIPYNNILGDPEVKMSTEGFKGVMKTFDNTRPMVAAMATGIARAAVEFTKEQFEQKGYTFDYKKNTANISAVERELYMMEANVEAMRLLTWRAAWMADNGQFNNLEASMAKAKAGRYATLVTQRCCELLGPVGYSTHYLAEKWMRDSKIMDIFEGTGQIQHLIVARNVLEMSSKELK
ncbi:MAG TPA: acyl-CoA dehydrogenase family protein [Spirochaetota bacterium]|nr:acyl-CoA dehydrogenase family protein [Spirochaetota bacterium]HOM86443.1 acyl-CoA dehydrogenase family protein [Spirochaetota bacterium]HOR93495.1 acyl-CoA dehydrogenase family protein [Spirochaetota bacterium]HOT20305.1 acyl-CoA dehydrogenase family protein [Spirochaetota bacterium]HPD04202.1 acyl-CoA dehydrogenase family protein [Spirochaetota bacterium]